MSINISVSGSTIKDCQEQILAMAEEIKGGDLTYRDPVPQKHAGVHDIGSQVKVTEPAMFQGQGNVMKFPLQPEAVSAQPSMVQPGNTPTGSTVDSRGIPWDARIHSSNKETVGGGVWRKRRGVEDSVVATVEAELRGSSPAPVKTAPPFGSMTQEQYKAVVQPAPMPTTEHRVALPEQGGVLNTMQAPAPVTPMFAPPTPVALPPNTHNAESFRNNLINVLNDLVNAGKINHEWINQNKAQFGGKDVTQWHENQAACEGLFSLFVQHGLINRL